MIGGMSNLKHAPYHLFQESFPCPFETVPTADKYKSANVFVESKDGPHGYQSPPHTDAKNVTANDLYRPHHSDAYVHRKIDVTSTPEGIHSEEVECPSVFR